MGEAKRRRAAAASVLPNGIRMARSRATPEGHELGSILAKCADDGEPAARLEFPAHAARCQSCAFRAGTVPNGCPETVVDAMGCLVENIPFMCHINFDEDGRPPDLCAGWAFARKSRLAREMAKALDGKMPYMPFRAEAAQAYLDEERRKIRAKRAPQPPHTINPAGRT